MTLMLLLLAGFFAITGSPPFGPFISELTIIRGAIADHSFGKTQVTEPRPRLRARRGRPEHAKLGTCDWSSSSS